MKKNSNHKINEFNIFNINVQVILTICTVVLFAMYFFNKEFLWLFEIFAGFTLLDLGYNNYKIYMKGKFITIVYTVTGIVSVILGILNVIGI